MCPLPRLSPIVIGRATTRKLLVPKLLGARGWSSIYLGRVFADQMQKAAQVYQLGPVHEERFHCRPARGRVAQDDKGIGTPSEVP